MTELLIEKPSANTRPLGFEAIKCAGCPLADMCATKNPEVCPEPEAGTVEYDSGGDSFNTVEKAVEALHDDTQNVIRLNQQKAQAAAEKIEMLQRQRKEAILRHNKSKKAAGTPTPVKPLSKVRTKPPKPPVQTYMDMFFYTVANVLLPGKK